METATSLAMEGGEVEAVCSVWASSLLGPQRADVDTGKLVPIDVKVGDRILFGKWSGTEVKLDGKDLLIMKETDIMGIIG